MSTSDLTLMNAMVQRMDWQEERQKLLAQNIANADTPNYRPLDVTPIDFKSMLSNSTSSASVSAARLATTNEGHIGLGGTSGSSDKGNVKKQKKTYEVTPTGNSVVLEEQLLKMNENMSDHRFTTNLYQKNIDMIKLSLKSQ